MARSNNYRTALVLFVNGIKVTDDDVDPEWTLLRYLRKKLKLTGSKNGCSEGGCGACTVMVSEFDNRKGRVVHFTVNACLTPVCRMDSKAITTVEALGSVETRLHPVQERLALAHGSQCGFCTPGFVMSMYTLLRNNPIPTMEEIEENLVGNLCRCTGYRPILEGFKTFAKNEGPTSSPCGRSDCCQLKGNPNSIEEMDTHSSLEKMAVLFKPENFKALDPSQDLIFPPDLLLKHTNKIDSLHLTGPRVQFFRPTSLQQLLEVEKHYPGARLIGGNTEIGVEVKFKNQFYPVLVDISNLEDLCQVNIEEDFVSIGAAVPLSTLDDEFKNTSLPGHKQQVLKEVCGMLKWFAGRQIRNVATLGGNVMTGSPISDMNPILMATKAVLFFKSLNRGDRKILMDEHFFSGYRKNIAKPDEVLVSIQMPLTDKYEFLRAYKQARRRQDDIAIVNCCFRVRFEPESQTIADIHLVYGGMGPTTVMALKTMQKLRGRSWMDCLEDGLTSLREELDLNPSVPGGMADYRIALSLSFFFKFHLETRRFLQDQQIVNKTSSSVELESISGFNIPDIKSVQFFQKTPKMQEPLDPIGRPIATVSGLKQTTGEAIYVDDLPQLSNELHAAFILSSKALAKIISIDTQEASKIKGVHAIYTGEDISDERNKVATTEIYDEVLFGKEKVNCVGQILGVVVAEDPGLARRAARSVKIHYQDLPNPIITIKDAVDSSSYLSEPWVIDIGDVEAAFSSCYKCLEGQFYMGGQEHFYMETNQHIAIPGEADEIEVIGTTQGLDLTQRLVAHALGIPENKVVCKVKRLGGGFGGKENRACPIAAAVAFAAKKIRRPVRLGLDRHEDMLITGTRHPMLSRWKVGFDQTGRIQALKADIYANCGWSTDLSFSVVQKSVHCIDNAYRINNMKVSGHCSKTNLPSNTAFRGFGGPQGMMIMEDVVSKVSEFLQIEPTKVRKLNFYKANGDFTHMGIPLEDFTLERCWEEVLQSSHYQERKKAILHFNRESIYKKRGIYAIPTKFGISFSATFLNQGGALVNVYRDGTVLISHGGVEMGQGLHTKMIQVASRVLGISINKIHVAETSTDKVPNSSPSAASASSDLYGMAVIDACEKLLSRLEPFKKKNPSGLWEEWIKSAYFSRVSLSAAGYYATPDIEPFDFKTRKGRCFSYYTVGAAVSEVEVDCLTGDHWVVQTDIVMDLGNSLNPAIDIGQIEGGFAQGLGLFTIEELKYFPDGTLFTRGPGAYKIPGSHDIPRSFNVSLLRDSKNPRAIYSSKAVGEPPLFLASSVFFAIKEAIKAYRKANGKLQSFDFNSPATAENIRMACLDSLTDKVGERNIEDSKPWCISV